VLLALDVRNDGIVVGFRSGEDWTTIVRLGADRSADELGILLEACARRAGIEPGMAFDEAWISSVVPALTPRVVDAISSTFGLTASVVGPGTRTGIKIRTDTPSELGSDIVCAAVAARAISDDRSEATVIVDFGSALVLTAVNASDELLGVSIAPGIETAARSLRSSTAQIHQVRLDAPGRAIGRNTAQSIQSGILLGYRGLIRALVGSMTDEMGETAMVLGTGDESGRAVMEGAGYPRFERHLALDGLAIIAERNRR
jgi:type III pantothenate kinase